MDLTSLYGMELSLFNGDLLDGFLPPVVSEDKHSQDGIVNTVNDGIPISTMSSGDQQLLSTEHKNVDLLDPLGMGWYDSKLDLVDFLQDGIDAAPGYNDLSLISEVPGSSDVAVQVLKSMAEDTSRMLDDDSSNSSLLESSADTSLEVSASSLLDMLADGMYTDDIDDAVAPTLQNNTILAPMSPQDVESILSSGQCSPVDRPQDLSIEVANIDSIASDKYNFNTMDLSELLSQVQNQQVLNMNQDLEKSPYTSGMSDSESDPDYAPSTSRSKPYSRKKQTKGMSKEDRALERKLRKKQQNKDAATRYRQKKRSESKNINQECEELEQRNTQLKDTVDQMTREISYLKNLLSEVYKAKGITTS